MRLLITISILFSLQMAGALAIDIPKARPDQNGLPTKVTVSYYILDIEEIDNKNQSFTIDLIIRLKWKDERLLHETGDIRVPIQEIWNPNVYFFNLRDAETRLPEIVNISQDGTVQYTQRYYAILGSPLNFKEFPFDVQTLTVSVIAFGYTPEEVQLVFENAGSEKNYSVSDWEIISMRSRITSISFTTWNWITGMGNPNLD